MRTVRIAASEAQKSGARWDRVARTVLTVVTLSAVAAVGVAQFGPQVLAAWKAPGKAERALASRGLLKGLLNFEAPAQTVARGRVETDEAQASIRRAENAALVGNWRYTQGPPADLLLQLGQQFQALQQAVANVEFQIAQLEASIFSAAFSFASSIVNAYISLLNSFFQSITISSAPINVTKSSSSSSSSHSASPHH